eukprot:scaffold30_cov416-Prasinococcus_capsulatus_cf.AAC.6
MVHVRNTGATHTAVMRGGTLWLSASLTVTGETDLWGDYGAGTKLYRGNEARVERNGAPVVEEGVQGQEACEREVSIPLHAGIRIPQWKDYLYAEAWNEGSNATDRNTENTTEQRHKTSTAWKSRSSTALPTYLPTIEVMRNITTVTSMNPRHFRAGTLYSSGVRTRSTTVSMRSKG